MDGRQRSGHEDTWHLHVLTSVWREGGREGGREGARDTAVRCGRHALTLPSPLHSTPLHSTLTQPAHPSSTTRTASTSSTYAAPHDAPPQRLRTHFVSRPSGSLPRSVKQAPPAAGHRFRLQLRVPAASTCALHSRWQCGMVSEMQHFPCVPTLRLQAHAADERSAVTLRAVESASGSAQCSPLLSAVGVSDWLQVSGLTGEVTVHLSAAPHSQHSDAQLVAALQGRLDTRTRTRTRTAHRLRVLTGCVLCRSVCLSSSLRCSARHWPSRPGRHLSRLSLAGSPSHSAHQRAALIRAATESLPHSLPLRSADIDPVRASVCPFPSLPPPVRVSCRRRVQRVGGDGTAGRGLQQSPRRRSARRQRRHRQPTRRRKPRRLSDTHTTAHRSRDDCNNQPARC